MFDGQRIQGLDIALFGREGVPHQSLVVISPNSIAMLIKIGQVKLRSCIALLCKGLPFPERSGEVASVVGFDAFVYPGKTAQ